MKASVEKTKKKKHYASLGVRVLLYFMSFTAALLALIWVLQTVFLDRFYQDMKIQETQETAQNIIDHYEDPDIVEQIRVLYIKGDMFIQLERADGTVLFSPSGGEGNEPWRRALRYFEQLQAVREQLIQSGQTSVSAILNDPRTDSNTLSYAAYIEKPMRGEDGQQLLDEEGKPRYTHDILIILSPLYPVSSTVDILRTMLRNVTIIAVIVALILSLILARSIARPIRKMTKDAQNLAEGRFGMVFEGGSYSEVSEMADVLTYTSLELEKSANLQRDLIANVSHDLRTPLTMVKSYAEMIRDISGDNPEKRNEHLEVIIEEADRLNVLVSDMLSLSKMQSGAIVLNKTSFDFCELARGIVHSYGIFCEREGYIIDFSCPESLFVEADEERMKQVMNNLITNAIKYCGSDCRIEIELIYPARENERSLRCEVRDHGMGIAKDELEKIWERYYKSSTNHVRQTKGSGLGLSIVKEILLLHGARFGVESELGKGSTFWFELEAEEPG